MTFVWMFLTAFVVIGVWKIGRIFGRHEEKKNNERAAIEATKKRTITLLGGPVSGQVVQFSEAELRRHNHQLRVHTTLGDGGDWDGFFEVQGDVGIYTEEVEG